MTATASTVDNNEIERFSRIAEEWWDENGKFRPLHKMGPLRLGYIRDAAALHFGRDKDAMRVLEGLSIIDIGCGGGLISEPMARMGAKVTGIDASEKNIAVATLHAQKMGLTIDYRCTSPEEMKSGGFDVVLALEIVEHVADVPEFLNACSKLVKPGGLIIMSTLNRTVKSFGAAIVGAEYVLRWLPRGTHKWKKFLKPSELCAGLRRAGLEVTGISGMGFNPLKNSWALSKDLGVNYIVTGAKPKDAV